VPQEKAPRRRRRTRTSDEAAPEATSDAAVTTD
jgi:hypothetical protein